MVNNKVNTDAQLKRMKALMNYGINESKQPEYSSVEYGKVAADGKLYGIVREGTSYYIKVAKNAKGGLVSENFDYINGFRNRGDNKFDSFASAQRFFCEKMSCINEATDDVQKRVISEAWDLQGKKDMIEEQTKKVQDEIARQRQIMENVVRIAENKSQKTGKKCDKCGCDPCKCKDMPDCEKPDVLDVKEVKGGAGAPFNVKLTNDDIKSTQNDNIKGKKQPVKESTEVPLSSRKNPDYMDKTHGTKIGSNAPFEDDLEDEPEGAVADAEGGEAIHEDVSMIASPNNQNKPAPGTDGEDDEDSAPFDENAIVTEALDDIDDELDDDVEDEDLIGDEEGEDIDSDAEFELETGDDDEDVDVDIEGEDGEGTGVDVDVQDDGLAARMDSLEAKLDSILDAINNMKYDDSEKLYDDEEETEEDGDLDDEDDFGDEEEEDVTVIESKSYREMKKKAIKEESDFGKHPAYQKKVMTLPKDTNPETDGQYDMNDDSVEGEKPFGLSKGNQKPFEVSAQQVEDAITESIMKVLKKKLN